MRSSRSVRVVLKALVFAVLCSVMATSSPAQVESSASAGTERSAIRGVVNPVLDCGKLQDADISAQVGSKTHIDSATLVNSSKPAPYCRVIGNVEPAIKFEVRLPVTTWTQRFVQTGCGGLCGQLSIHLGNSEGCYPADHGELALASTDMGHSGGMDGRFGEKDYQLRVDFAYRGVHLTTLAAKALIATFYGKPARYSYFSGCSDGGREALMEAQRFPEDFDGITAGAAAMNFTTQNTFYHGWNAVRNTDATGNPILTADKLPILHRAVLQACDAADGLKDGLISEPLSCHFDPSVVQCKAGQDQKECLNAAQVQTAREIYSGAHDDKGQKLVLSGPLPGSELAWEGVYVPQPRSSHTLSPMISLGTLKYLASEANPPNGYTLKDLSFTADSFAATTQLHGLYDATDPNLKPFEAKGGKLILWHGLADPHISPLNSIAYYTAMNGVMGEAAVEKFARLYLFPGGYHCGGGEGPFNVDLLSVVMAWVEKGTAPFALVASHRPDASGGPIAGVPSGMPRGGPQGPGPQAIGSGAQDMQGPPPSGLKAPSEGADSANESKVDRTRPIYPYPLTAKYSGKGSIDDAKNFTSGPARLVPAERLTWLGSSFYRPNYEVWCTGEGAKLNCQQKP